MVEHENICRGATGFVPSPNQKIKSKSEYWKEFIKNSAKYNKIDESKVKEYMTYESRKVK